MIDSIGENSLTLPIVNFENLNRYILDTHIKFHSNQILFTIRLINLFFMHKFRPKNLKFKHLIDDRAIDL